MPYFSPYKETKFLVDASPVGIAGILVQDDQPIAYGSRALSDVESRYSQTEREALAVVWACEHFDIYVRGSSCTVVTDHKPLMHIWSKPRPPLWIARWSLRLRPYDLTIVFRPGKDNAADYMCRHPATKDVRSSREEKIAEEYVEFISQTSVPNAIALEEVRAATAKDKALQTLIELCSTGHWHEVNKYDVDQAALRQFQNVRDELTVNRHGNLLLRSTRIVMPTSLQARTVQLAHEGHQSTSKTKALIRSKVWFPGLDTAVYNAVRRCIPCQANTTRQYTEPLNMSNLPRWSVDQPQHRLLWSSSVWSVLDGHYRRLFSFSYCRGCTLYCCWTCYSSRGQSILHLWISWRCQNRQRKGFLKTCGIKHRKITPLWPKANGQVENFNKPLMNLCDQVGQDPGAELDLWYASVSSSIPLHSSYHHRAYSIPSPVLVTTRKRRCQMLNHSLIPTTVMCVSAMPRQKASWNAMQTNAYMLVKQPRLNKLSTPFNATPLVVTERNGTMVTTQRGDGSKVTRNFSMFRSIPQTLIQENDTRDDSCENILPFKKETSPSTGLRLEWGSSTWRSSLTSGCYTQLWSHSHRSPSS